MKRKSIPRLLGFIYARKRKQAKDEKRLDGLYRMISASTIDVRTCEHRLSTPRKLQAPKLR